MVEMPVNDAMRHVVDLPRQRGRAWNVRRALAPEQIIDHQRVVQVHGADFVNKKGIAVVIRLQRRGGERPDALAVLHHAGVRETLALHLDIARIRRLEPESDPPVRQHFSRRAVLGKGRRNENQRQQQTK